MIKNLSLESKFIFFTILSLPIFAVLSIFILESILIILTLLFLKKISKSKEWFYFDNWFIKYFFLFYIYILFNSLFQNQQESPLSIIFYFRYILYTLSLSFFFYQSKILLDIFLKLVLGLTILLSVDSIFQFLFGYNLVGMQIIEKWRVSSFFGDELILGSFLYKLTPLLLTLAIYSTSQMTSKLSYFATLLAIISIFLSGERSSLFLLFLYFFLLIIYFYKILDLKIIIKIILSIFIIFFSIIFLSEDYRYRFIKQPLNDLLNSESYNPNLDVLRSYDGNKKFLFFSGQHHNYMITSLKIFNDNKIFGSGPRSYRVKCKDENYKINRYSCSTHPHNFYFQLLSETGIIGASFLIILYFILIIFFFRKKKFTKINNIKSIILIYYLSALWPIIPHGNIFNNWLSITLYLPASIIFFYNIFLNKKK